MLKKIIIVPRIQVDFSAVALNNFMNLRGGKNLTKQTKKLWTTIAMFGWEQHSFFLTKHLRTAKRIP